MIDTKKLDRMIDADPWYWEWQVEGFTVKLVHGKRPTEVFNEDTLWHRLDSQEGNRESYTPEAYEVAIRMTKGGLSLFRAHWNRHITTMMDDLESAFVDFENTGDRAGEVETLWWKIDSFLDEGPETTYDDLIQKAIERLRPQILSTFKKWGKGPDSSIWGAIE